MVDSSQWPELWQAAYRILEQTLVPDQLRAWIQPLQLVSTDASESGTALKIQFAAPNDFSAQWVRDRFLKQMEAAFTQVTGSPCEVVFVARKGPDNAASSMEPYEAQSVDEQRPSSAAPVYEAPTPPTNSGMVLHSGSRAIHHEAALLDPKYTFDSFVVGASNQFAHASAIAVGEQPGRQYNPLFLYSAPGLGKTHLLHAIGNHVLAKNPNARVGYLSAERFMNELIESIQHNRMSQFRTKYRDSYDLILIDDIQFIAGKEKTEEEFFHTFNVLHASKRQIVVTSDRAPKDIEGLQERIRTRFEWGLVADIQPPEIETRIAILKAKAERDDIYLPDDVATFLASHIKTNVRELEGVLIRLQAQASLTGAEISLEMAKHELKANIPEEGAHITVESIQAAVAKHFHLKIQDFKSSSRAKQVALPRQIAMYLVRKYTGIGYKEIGQYFGGKDHTTTLHAFKKIDNGVDHEPEIREAVESIQNLL
jgi:chromosomal replication initiator protein